eukprot:505328-Pyramimonas_sp.AAC.1
MDSQDALVRHLSSSPDILKETMSKEHLLRASYTLKPRMLQRLGPAKTAAVPSSASRVERRVPMSRLRRRVADRLKQSQNTYALLTTFNEVDMTNLMALRNEYK